MIVRPSTLSPAAPSGRNQAFANWFGSVLLLVLVATVPAAVSGIQQQPLTYLMLFIIGGASVFGQVRAIKKGLAAHFIAMLFCYLFLSVMPVLQIAYKIDPVFRQEHVALFSAIASFLFVIIGLNWTSSVAIADQGSSDAKGVPTGSWQFRYGWLAIAVVVFASATVLLFGRSLFSSREGFGQALGRVFSDRATAGAVTNFLMQMPFFGSAIGLRAAMAEKNKKWSRRFLVLLLVSALINNPIVMPRFRIAGLAFFFVDYYFFRERIRLLIFLMVSGISLAPLFQVFRHTGSTLSAATYDKFLSTDYDAFQMACYTVVTVAEKGVTWGSNVLGSLLFFVPRALWPGKPEPSSFAIYDVASHFEKLGTNNLSVPLMMEGYYAFSWIGVLLISLAFWAGISRLYNDSLKDPNSISFLMYSILSGVMLILLRGPLITGVTAIAGNFGAAFLAWRIFHGRTRAIR